MNHTTLTIMDTGRILFENGKPNSKEANASYYLRVHTENDVFHVVSFAINRISLPASSANSIARNAVQAVMSAEYIEVWDLNDKHQQWKRVKR